MQTHLFFLRIRAYYSNLSVCTFVLAFVYMRVLFGLTNNLYNHLKIGIYDIQNLYTCVDSKFIHQAFIIFNRFSTFVYKYQID